MVGPPYQVAVRLILIAQERWVEIDGEATLKGGQVHDLMMLPVDRFLNAVYVWCIQRLSEEDFDRWVTELNAPLLGRETERDHIAEMDAFASFAGAFGVKARPSG